MMMKLCETCVRSWHPGDGLDGRHLHQCENLDECECGGQHYEPVPRKVTK